MRSYEQFPEDGEGALKPHHYPDYIRFSTLFIFASLLLGIYFSKDSITAIQAFHRAEKYYDAGNLEAAKRNYVETLHYAPQSQDAKIGMAIACFATKDTADDEHGLNCLDDLYFSDNEWERIQRVLPEKFKKYFTKDSNP